MKRIVIYGLGNRCGMWHEWLMKEYEVVCFVVDQTSVNAKTIRGIPVICQSELFNYEYEALLILTDRKSDEIYEEVSRLESNCGKIFWLDDFLEEEGKKGDYEDFCVKEQKRILKEILAASDEEIHDYQWVYNKVIKFGLYCFRSLWLEWDEEINWTVCGIQQMPEEFTKFCIFLSDLKISSAIDIGVYKGRSSYFVCAILMRNNQDLSYTLVDIEDRLDHFEDYYEVLPSLVKAIPHTSDDYKDQTFDYVFIDADHTYEGSMADYENVGKNARILVAFHDIYAHEYDSCDGGTVRTWKEVSKKEAEGNCYTFAKYPDEWMGIGCIYKNR